MMTYQSGGCGTLVSIIARSRRLRHISDFTSHSPIYVQRYKSHRINSDLTILKKRRKLNTN